MPNDRFFTDSDLSLNSVIHLGREEAHHLVRVMRAKEGDSVSVINGKGQLALATVTVIQRKGAELAILSVSTAEKTQCPITLLQALPRPNRLDTIIEKSTELGVDAIHLFPGKLSEASSLSPARLQRLQHIAIAATKQCGRLFLPEVKIISPIKSWSMLPTNTFYGDIAPNAQRFKEAWTTRQLQSGVQFIVGPEAGLHKDEETNLKNLGAIGVRLHNHILRTDTAPIVALSLIQHWLLDP